jgi:hypothetical protein
MSQLPRDANRLEAELAQLRTALRGVSAPPPDEQALRAQFREHWRKHTKNAAAERAGGSRRIPLAAAAAVVLAVGAAATVFTLRDEAAAPPTVAAAADAPSDSQPAVGAFQPLLSSPGLPSSSYSVVRVRIPVSAFAVVPGTTDGGTIEADLLVGEDGLARAIRFNEADLIQVSVADQ